MDLTIQELIDMFIASRVSYCAEASIEYYQDCLTLFGSFLSSRGFSSPRDLTKQLLSDYSVYLRDGRQIKATSIHTNFRAINAFLAWMIEEDYMDEFRYHIKLPRQNPEIVLPLSGAEVQVLLDTIKKRSFEPIRDVCIFRLMLGSGWEREPCHCMDAQNPCIWINRRGGYTLYALGVIKNSKKKKGC